jgi:hypothetical protein
VLEVLQDWLFNWQNAVLVVICLAAIWFGFRAGLLGLGLAIAKFAWGFPIWGVSWLLIIPLLSIFRFNVLAIAMVFLSNLVALIGALMFIVTLQLRWGIEGVQVLGLGMVLGCVYVLHVTGLDGWFAYQIWNLWCHTSLFDGLHETPERCAPLWVPRVFGGYYGWR